MKKILFWSSVTIIAAASCNKLEDDTPTLGSETFAASIEGIDTRTVIDGMKSYWNGTESIRIFDGKLTSGKVYTATVEKAESAILKHRVRLHLQVMTTWRYTLVIS